MFLIQNAPGNRPVPVIDDVPLHSLQDPQGEGLAWADAFLKATLHRKAELLVVGLGFGYHILPLIEHYRHVTILEPDRELTRAGATLDILKPVYARCAVLDDPDEIIPGTYDVYILPAMNRLNPQLVHYAQEHFGQPEPPANAVPALAKGLRVLVDTPIYGGSLSVSRYVAQAWSELGAEVLEVDNTLHNPMLQQVLQYPDEKLKAEQCRLITQLAAGHFWQMAQEFKPQIAFFNAQSPITVAVLDQLRQAGVFTMFWFVEDYNRFGYWRDIAPRVDLFAVIQKEPFFASLKQAGASYLYLPLAAAPSVHKPLDYVPDDYKAEIAFMGAAYPNRVQWFRQLTGYKLKLWGVGWDDQVLQPYVQAGGRWVSPEETTRIYNGADIVINLHSGDGSGTGKPDFVNPRTFEVAACGAFQLVDERFLLPDLLTPGQEVITFSCLADLKQKIDYYLAHPEERQKVAEAARQKVLEQHTYVARMAFLYKFLCDHYPQFTRQRQNSGLTPLAEAAAKVRELPTLELSGAALLILDEFRQMQKSTLQ